MKNLIKIFFAVIFSFLPLEYAKAESVTVISDIHLVSDKAENKMTPSIRRLIKAVNQANLDTSDFVVYLGDNISSANRVDVAMFAKVIKKTKKPCYVTLGNKDISKTRGVLKKDYYRIVNKFSSNKISNLPTYKKHKELVLVFMGGVNESFPSLKGYYKTSEIDFLDFVLTKFEDKKVVIFQHFPIVPPKEDKEKETVKTENYLKVLEKHNNVIAIVSGHYGVENITEENSIKHISVPSLSSSGEYEQIKFIKNSNGKYTITTRIYNVE